MKKFLSILLVLAMVLGLSACGQSKKTEQPTENNAITLTKENISQYLNITIKGPSSGSDYLEIITVEIYPTEAGNFSNVDLILFLDLSDYYLEMAFGPELYGKGTTCGTLCFELPADGKHKFDLMVNPSDWANPYDAIEEYIILSASGTFTPAN